MWFKMNSYLSQLCTKNRKSFVIIFYTVEDDTGFLSKVEEYAQPGYSPPVY